MPDDAARKRFLRRLERLARQLTSGRWDSGQGLWDWQLALLNLQRDIQDGITVLKCVRRTADQHALLDWFKDMRWHARRLGDAFAWVILGLETRVLHSLAENDRVPVSVDDHSSRAMTAIAVHLCGDGRGFPVLHDITDCLRIGDITFVDVTAEPRTVRTVEIKNRVIDERSTSDGKSEYTYQVQVIFHAARSELSPSLVTPTTDEVSVTVKQKPANLLPRSNRIDRQMARMSGAVVKQNAIPGEIAEITGQGLFMAAEITAETSSHWKALRRIIRKARADGYASEIIDHALMYVAFYCDAGLTEDSIKDPRIVEDVTRSGIFDRTPDRFPNSLVICGVPPDKNRGGLRYFLPHFLYTIPFRAISDLLHHRLVILVLVNPGQLVDALEAAGLEVRNDSGIPDLQQGSIVAPHHFQDAEGGTWQIELRNLSWHISELIYEFKAVDHMVATALGMRDAALKAFAERNGIQLLNHAAKGRE